MNFNRDEYGHSQNQWIPFIVPEDAEDSVGPYQVLRLRSGEFLSEVEPLDETIEGKEVWIGEALGERSVLQINGLTHNYYLNGPAHVSNEIEGGQRGWCTPAVYPTWALVDQSVVVGDLIGYTGRGLSILNRNQGGGFRVVSDPILPAKYRSITAARALVVREPWTQFIASLGYGAFAPGGFYVDVEPKMGERVFTVRYTGSTIRCFDPLGIATQLEIHSRVLCKFDLSHERWQILSGCR